MWQNYKNVVGLVYRRRIRWEKIRISSSFIRRESVLLIHIIRAYTRKYGCKYLLCAFCVKVIPTTITDIRILVYIVSWYNLDILSSTSFGRQLVYKFSANNQFQIQAPARTEKSDATRSSFFLWQFVSSLNYFIRTYSHIDDQVFCDNETILFIFFNSKFILNCQYFF